MVKKKTAKIVQIGNSLGFRIPKKYFDVLNMKKGDELSLDVKLNKNVFTLKKLKRRKTL
ncbi:MAG: hypothetical protein KAS04_07240 [Candidatus Aenigmarchaeota archaeon]|nr:hypothetical protein [Candidatus Aenigmarchaeota archaeon]